MRFVRLTSVVVIFLLNKTDSEATAIKAAEVIASATRRHAGMNILETIMPHVMFCFEYVGFQKPEELLVFLKKFPTSVTTRQQKCFLRCVLRRAKIFKDPVGKKWSWDKSVQFLLDFGYRPNNLVSVKSALFFCMRRKPRVVSKYGCKNAYNFFTCLRNHGLSFSWSNEEYNEFRKWYVSKHPEYPILVDDYVSVDWGFGDAFNFPTANGKLNDSSGEFDIFSGADMVSIPFPAFGAALDFSTFPSFDGGNPFDFNPGKGDTGFVNRDKDIDSMNLVSSLYDDYDDYGSDKQNSATTSTHIQRSSVNQSLVKPTAPSGLRGGTTKNAMTTSRVSSIAPAVFTLFRDLLGPKYRKLTSEISKSRKRFSKRRNRSTPPVTHSNEI